MLCQFQMNSKVIQLYMDMDLFFLKFFSHLGITEHWAEFPVPYSRSLLVIHFKYSSVYISSPISLIFLGETSQEIIYGGNSHYLRFPLHSFSICFS